MAACSRLHHQYVRMIFGKDRFSLQQVTAELNRRGPTPFANKLTIHILAAVAEHEREAISARTKAALAAAKARGVKLGGPKLRLAQRNGATANRAEADRFAANTLPLIREAQKTGASSLRAIAGILNARGVRTARGGKWAATQVRDIMLRTE